MSHAQSEFGYSDSSIGFLTTYSTGPSRVGKMPCTIWWRDSIVRGMPVERKATGLAPMGRSGRDDGRNPSWST